jgi:flagellar basal-body rod protein FlgB
MIGKLDDYLRFNETALSPALPAPGAARVEHRQRRHAELQGARHRFRQRAAGRAGARPAAGGAGRPPPRAISQPAADGKALPDGTPVLYRGVAQGAVDGNTVDMDVERNQFADNALRYEAGITMINHQIRGLLAAIQNGQ